MHPTRLYVLASGFFPCTAFYPAPLFAYVAQLSHRWPAHALPAFTSWRGVAWAGFATGFPLHPWTMAKQSMCQRACGAPPSETRADDETGAAHQLVVMLCWCPGYDRNPDHCCHCKPKPAQAPGACDSAAVRRRVAAVRRAPTAWPVGAVNTPPKRSLGCPPPQDGATIHTRSGVVL
mgnify:CR=1 FL=1